VAYDEITLADLAAEEDELQFATFSNDDAWALGTALVATAREQQAPVAIDITRNRHQLFHAALAGTTPDNDAWIKRKTRVVNRFGHSSLYMGQLCREQDTTFEQKYGLNPGRYAAHGGAFPITVKSVGTVGVVVVSGLPQIADHRLVVAVVRQHLAQPSAG
jgi:uncharacterized protein (UPF0303 family)